MPELPEVETIVRGLRDRVQDLEFSEWKSAWESACGGQSGP